jgi:large subunit ribosomal protein L4
MAEKALKATTLGKQAKTDLPATVFGEDFHESLVHEAARADLAARRRGTASSLGRGEVSMTGAKAWKQKGTGRARAGALSVPHRRGGGAAFGPKPRSHTFKVNRKARRRALRSAFSVHATRDSIAVFDGAVYDTPSTKSAAEALGKWGGKGPTLILCDPDELGVVRSFRNLPKVDVLPVGSAGVADVIGHASLIISATALDSLESRLGEVSRASAKTSTPGGEAEDVASSDSEEVAS